MAESYVTIHSIYSLHTFICSINSNVISIDTCLGPDWARRTNTHTCVGRSVCARTKINSPCFLSLQTSCYLFLIVVL